MSGAVGRGDASDAQKGRVETTKVKRYRPGQVPAWMKSTEDDFELPSASTKTSEPTSSQQAGGIAAPVIVKKADDPRLRRLAGAAAVPVDRADRHRHRHRHQDEDEDEERDNGGIAAPQIIRRAREKSSSDVEDNKEDEEEDEDAVAARRAALKQRMRDEEEEAAATAVLRVNKEEEGQEEEEDSSEYTSDDDSDYETGGGLGGFRPLAKPVFVPKTNRETMAEREALEKEEEEAAEKERMRLEIRKEETKNIIAQRIAEEEAQAAAAATAAARGADDIITDDEEADEEAEYDRWRMRELRRIGREREEREKEIRDAEEARKWREMSEEDRLRYLAAQPKTQAQQQQEKDKKKYKFLQKYYHRGAFFQTEAEYRGEEAPLVGVNTLHRDFSAPTGEDLVDKSMLPSIMQVKNFGKRGRTKWTHLKDQDTTNFEAPWAANNEIRAKMERKLAGTDQEFTKPKTYKT